MEELQIKNDENQNDDASIKLKVNSKTNEMADEIVSSDVSNLIKRREVVKRIDNFGKQTLDLAMQRSKNLSSTISTMTQTSSNNELDKNLEKLEKELRTIDPTNVDFSVITKGLNKFFSPITKYFKKFEQEESNIEEIITSLNTGRNILSNDNITMELEIDKINETIRMLNAEYENGTIVKKKIEEVIEKAKLDCEDANKIAFYEEEVLIPLEKKLYDIKEIILVNEQSAMAMEIIRKNNKELIRNVDRIKNVTLVAVNTAVAVAKSLYNQKIVLKKIDALNSATEKNITNTGRKLNEKATSISKEIEIKSATIDGLKNAFENAFAEIKNVEKENEIKLEIPNKIELGKFY